MKAQSGGLPRLILYLAVIPYVVVRGLVGRGVRAGGGIIPRPEKSREARHGDIEPHYHLCWRSARPQ
jgi:hypothetical protein